MDHQIGNNELVVASTVNKPARSRIRLAWGKASLEADAEISPSGLLAIGGMVGMILLAVAPIVRAGKGRRRF